MEKARKKFPDRNLASLLVYVLRCFGYLSQTRTMPSLE